MLDQRYSDNDVSKRDIPSFIEPRPPLIQNPFMRPRPQKGTNLLELFEEDSEIEEPELVQVYLRLKPCKIPNSLYEVRSDKCLVTSLDTATAGHGRRTQHNVSKMYTFSKIFGPESNQKEIFEQIVKDNLKKLPEGHNFTLLTYGASGSGKTYTLMGTVGSPGLVPRSLEYVFKLVDAAQQPVYKPAENGAEQLNYAEQDFELQWVKRLRHISAPLRDKYRRMSVQLHSDLTASSIDLSNRVRHYVWVSFVEIYNEAIYDLLAPPDKRTKLRIREDSSGNVYVKGATQAFVRSGEEAYDVMVAGKHNLVVAATGVHAHSSRSHCIFTITMLTETGESGGVRSACVRLCDLAGCERARATRNTGARMLESRAINSSLHVLERCLHMLRRKQRSRHDALVPYRESKLTRLLGTGLSGTRAEAVSMVVTLNPSPEYAHETKHVLSLAAVAQDIQVNNTLLVTTLESSTQDTTINCSNEVMKLRADNERLHFELVQAQARNKELMAAMEERQQEAANTMRELVEEAKDMTRQYYEAQLEALRSEMDDMVEEYESRLAKVPKEVRSSGSGTPSRFLQAKVAQLMTDIAIMEEKLTEERLARGRAEKEVQHLRTCIEERDEKAFKDALPPRDVVMDSSESDSESDEEASDPFNESLEPVFKKESNKSIAKQNDTISIHTIDNIDEENEDIDDDILDITTKANDARILTNVDEEKGIKNETITENDSANSTYESTKQYSVDNCNESINEKTNDSIHDKTTDNIEVESNINSFNCRGTYFVRDNKVNTNDTEEKTISSSRGTYCVGNISNINTNLNTDSNVKDVTIKHFKEPVIGNPKTVPTKSSDTLVTKIIKSIRSNHGSDSSLTQFEQLEMASKNFDVVAPKLSSVYSDIKMLKEKRIYFDSEPPKSAKKDIEIEIPNVITKEKRTFFDNIDVNTHVPNKKVELLKTIDVERSPSIVKDNLISENFEPNKIKKLLGESFNNPDVISSIHKRLGKKHESVDIFESPVVAATDEIVNNDIEMAKQSIEKLVLNQQSSKKSAKHDVRLNSPRKEVGPKSPKIDIAKSPFRVDIIRSPVKKDLTKSLIKMDSIEISTKKTTVELPTAKEIALSLMKDGGQLSIKSSDFKTDIQNEEVKLPINKDLASTQPLTRTEAIVNIKMEKDLIPTQNTVVPKIKKDKLEPVPSIDEANQTTSESNMTVTNNTVDEFENIYKEITEPRATEFELLLSQSLEENITTQQSSKDKVVSEGKDVTQEETKYNLRKKFSKTDDSKSDKAETCDEILLESQAKCESKIRKRPLRLRRKKTQDDEGSDNNKLKDIVNLQTEFSDVTMGIPAALKVVKDIPSPEKGTEENLPPVLGIQSCPAKSITRSRRKLFTPRAEPLEESLSQTGDSNERLYVPRPSYHRPRARRKL